jgi:hypothetical protein
MGQKVGWSHAPSKDELFLRCDALLATCDLINLE